MSDFLQPRGLQHTKLPCPSLSPRVCSNSCPLSHGHGDAIHPPHPLLPPSPPALNLSPQSFPAPGSFPMSWMFASGGQSSGASASLSALPMNIQGLFPLGWTSLISLLSKGLSREFSPAPQFEIINSSAFSLLYGPALTSIHY